MEKEFLFKDANRIAKTCADLDLYGKMLSEVVKQLKEANLVCVELTDAILADIVEGGGYELKQGIKAAYEKEASTIEMPYVRQRFLDGIAEAFQQVDKILAEWKERLEANILKLSYLTDYDRLKYLHFYKGTATYDRQEVIDDNTVYVEDDEQKKFINRAKTLFNSLVDFDKEIRALSRGGCYGVACEGPANDAVITCSDNGIIHLDLKYIGWLDFEHKDELLAKCNQIQNSKIWKAEQ